MKVTASTFRKQGNIYSKRKRVNGTSYIPIHNVLTPTYALMHGPSAVSQRYNKMADDLKSFTIRFVPGASNMRQ